MRTLTGASWDTNKPTLLFLYKALIRPVLLHGYVAFTSSGAHPNFNKLESRIRLRVYVQELWKILERLHTAANCLSPADDAKRLKVCIKFRPI